MHKFINMVKSLSVWESKKFLERYGIKFVTSELVREVDEAIRFAKRVGFPIVAKVSSPDVIHKTDVGGIVTNIQDEIELTHALLTIHKNVKAKVPNARVEGIILQKMVKGIEVIVGGIVDPTFGSCVSFGSGGIFTEVYQDVSFRVTPLTRKDALEMIKETKVYKVLKGFRNLPKANIRSLVDLLIKVSDLMEENKEVMELDLNPVFVTPKESLVADARIIVE